MSLALEKPQRVAHATRPSRHQRVRDVWIGRYMMIPALIIPACLAFTFGFGIFITLNFWRLTTGRIGFVGLANYGRVLHDAKFWYSALLTLKFTTLDVSIEIVVATLLAIALNQSLRGIGIYRSILILPLMTPPVVGALIWKVLFRSGTGGLFNFILWKMHLPQQGFLGSPSEALFSLVAIDIWLNAPFIAMIVLAGLQSLPREPIESAHVDGASNWQVFWRITLPMLVPFYIVALFFRVIDSLNVFDTIYGTTNGGPGNMTRVLPINGYENAFPFYNLSYGLTIFVVLWAVCILVGAIMYRRVKRAS